MTRIVLACIALCAASVAPGLAARGQADGADPVLAVATTGARAPAGVGAVTVDLLNVESSEGQLLAALFRDGRGFPDGGAKAFATSVQKAKKGVMRVNFERIPPGPYAVSVQHDADRDFKIDTGLFGIPTEGYGFSRNAHAPFGPPGFDDCKLVLKAGERHHLRIKLRY